MSSLELRLATKTETTSYLSYRKGCRIGNVIRVYSGSGVMGQICFFKAGLSVMDSGSKEGLWLHKSHLFPSPASKSLKYRKISAIGKRRRNASRDAMCNIYSLFQGDRRDCGVRVGGGTEVWV